MWHISWHLIQLLKEMSEDFGKCSPPSHSSVLLSSYQLSFEFMFLFLFLIQGVHPCDKRRSIREYHPLFPAIDFSLASNLGYYWCFIIWTSALTINFPVNIDFYASFQSNLAVEFNLVSIFVQLESDEDILWKPNIRENDEEVAARGLNFLKWWLPILLFPLFPKNWLFF